MNPRTRRTALYAIGVIAILASANALAHSYAGLYDWAVHHRLTGWQAMSWPAEIDVFLAVGELALYVAYLDGWPVRQQIWPWTTALVGLAVSIAGNVGHIQAQPGQPVILADRLTAATSPVAAFAGLTVGLLVLKMTRNRNPRWTPACSDTSLPRDPAGLAPVPGDIISVLAAVHYAADAIGRIAAKDQEAVVTAAADSRLYVPVRLLPDIYDIPQPYTAAPRQHGEALLAAYDAAVEAATRVNTALDDLATAVDAPSSLLAAARLAPASAWQGPRRQQQQQAVSQPSILTPVSGRTEHALHKLQIRDPALLLRAAVIDQAARDLVAEATAKAHSRDAVTAGPASRAVPGARHAASSPARVAGQDAPLTPRAAQQANHQRSSATPAARVSGSRPAQQGSRGARSTT